MKIDFSDTITALATPHGSGAIAVIRLSGSNSFEIIDKVFFSKTFGSKKINEKDGYTIHFGIIAEGEIVVDEVLVSIFRKPNSYTGEDSIEISCHGSVYVQQQILQILIKHGARMANAGEFTLRGFLNGKFDLVQAEAVADLIASNSGLSHQVAMQQMRGGVSDKIKILRQHLVNFASLIELELDFSEEDVEFANREDLKKLVYSIIGIIEKLVKSFEVGNVIKNGVPVAIVGKPNAGKSTLLNVLLDDDRAIVSDIPGTTRDTIEDEMVIDGVMFRFIDTAGLRTTSDVIEKIGVDKAYEAIRKSAIIIYLFDAHELSSGDLKFEVDLIKAYVGTSQLVVVANKIDIENERELKMEFAAFDVIYISAKEHRNIEELKTKLVKLFDARTVNTTETIVTNARHAEALKKANHALYKVLSGLDSNMPGDLLAVEIRYALDELGAITGEVSNEDLLSNIFSKFCIGK